MSPEAQHLMTIHCLRQTLRPSAGVETLDNAVCVSRMICVIATEPSLGVTTELLLGSECRRVLQGIEMLR